MHRRAAAGRLHHEPRTGGTTSRWPTANCHATQRSHRTVRCRSAAAAPEQQQQQQQQPQPVKDPFADKTVYTDGPIDKLFIKLFTQKMADQLQGVAVPAEATYEDFVRVSKEIMRGRNASQQRDVVAKVLQSLMPEQTPAVFRRLFPASQWSAELNAAIASSAFFWLVGDSELRSELVEVQPGQFRQQRSVVHIKKCRYLESSGCVGMCTNMCKVPTQDFFTKSFGLPLTMNPDFTDLSCQMVFGQAPPPLEQDPVYTQPCLSVCSLAQAVEPCPRVDGAPGQAPQPQQRPAAASGTS